jgi:hypothetical protein
MDADEQDIFNYLKTWGKEFVSVREVCRRAGTKQRFIDEPDWAKPLMLLMAERGILERDTAGRYRIKPKPKKKENDRWVAPNIAQMLKEMGVEGPTGGDGETEEPKMEDYEQH